MKFRQWLKFAGWRLQQRCISAFYWLRYGRSSAYKDYQRRRPTWDEVQSKRQGQERRLIQNKKLWLFEMRAQRSEMAALDRMRQDAQDFSSLEASRAEYQRVLREAQDESERRQKAEFRRARQREFLDTSDPRCAPDESWRDPQY